MSGVDIEGENGGVGPSAGRVGATPAVAGTGIVLNDFDAHPGLTLRLPADDQVRIVVLRDL